MKSNCEQIVYSGGRKDKKGEYSRQRGEEYAWQNGEKRK